MTDLRSLTDEELEVLFQDLTDRKHQSDKLLDSLQSRLIYYLERKGKRNRSQSRRLLNDSERILKQYRDVEQELEEVTYEKSVRDMTMSDWWNRNQRT